MSGDGAIQFRIWSHAGSMYRHMKRPADGLAANGVARNLVITRRDPMFASLGHARHAALLGQTGDANAVKRAISNAQEALDRADPAALRPVWLSAHYDQAELDSLSLAAFLSLGAFEDAEARAHHSLSLLHLPNYRTDVFAERLARHGTEPGWQAVVGYDSGEPVGYAYGNALTSEDRWWARMVGPLPEGYTDISTVALKEIGVRLPWRGTGVARRIHDAFLAGRTEERVTLLVNPLAGDGKVQALYESWGYVPFNSQQPSPDSPKLTAMIRPVVV